MDYNSTLHNNRNALYAESSNASMSTDNKRKRITRACDTCRRKKIKCNVDSIHPCGNCKQNDWECTFNDTPRKRGPARGYIETLEARLARMESLLTKMGGQDKDLKESMQTIETKKKKKKQQKKAEQDDEQQQQQKPCVVRYHGSSSGYYLVGSMFSNEDRQEDSAYTIPTSAGLIDFRVRKMNNYDGDLLVVRDATTDEVENQQAEDNQEPIENIFPKPVLKTLIYAFFDNAHDTLPIVDKDEYLNAFEGRSSTPPSPLLTYAICTYACFLVKSTDPVFKEAGIDRDSLFENLIERTSLLLRREYLRPRMITIQALVLLCANPTYASTAYRSWLLTGMAVRMAQDLGLHRTLTGVEIPHEQHERQKRLWYAVYATDRWCCAMMGRPLAIADADCDVDLPLIHGAHGNDDFTMFINFVKLSGILGEILRRIYSPKAKINGYKTKTMEQTTHHLQRMLESWFNQLPYNCKITEEDVKEVELNPDVFPANSKKILEGGPLTICYYSVVCLLHRPFIALDGDPVTQPFILRSFNLCRSAAKSAIDIAALIPFIATARFGWNFAAYSVFQATLIHLFNCTNPDPIVSAESKRYITVSIKQCLEPFCKDMPSGPTMVTFVQTLLSLIKIDNLSTTNESQPAQEKPQQTMLTEYTSSSNIPAPTIVPSDSGLLANLTENNSQSWLLNGNSQNLSNLSQTNWQQLLSATGTPFAEDADTTADIQGWDSFFMGFQTSNMFM